MEKFLHLLEHWIEHSKEHTARYEEWAEKLRQDFPEVSEKLMEAAEKFRDGEEILASILEMVGERDV